MHAQVDSQAVKEACPVPFDEGRLWKGEDGEELKRQLQAHFHNITKAMDCVGCEKCKLWGKLQILGALLYFLISVHVWSLVRYYDICTASSPILSPWNLHRNGKLASAAAEAIFMFSNECETIVASLMMNSATMHVFEGVCVLLCRHCNISESAVLSGGLHRGQDSGATAEARAERGHSHAELAGAACGIDRGGEGDEPGAG